MINRFSNSPVKMGKFVVISGTITIVSLFYYFDLSVEEQTRIVICNVPNTSGKLTPHRKTWGNSLSLSLFRLLGIQSVKKKKKNLLGVFFFSSSIKMKMFKMQVCITAITHI